MRLLLNLFYTRTTLRRMHPQPILVLRLKFPKSYFNILYCGYRRFFKKKIITNLERGFLEDPYSRGPDSWKIWNAKSWHFENTAAKPRFLKTDSNTPEWFWRYGTSSPVWELEKTQSLEPRLSKPPDLRHQIFWCCRSGGYSSRGRWRALDPSTYLSSNRTSVRSIFWEEPIF